MALLPTDPKRQKQLVIGVVPVLALFAYWYFLHGATTDEIAAMESRIERLDASNIQARSTAAQGGPELERRLELYTAHIARIERLIPTAEEVPELLHTISVQAEATGVELGLFRPQPAQIGPYYTRRLYEIAVTGSYHDIGRYLAAIASLPRIVTPIDLSLSVTSASADEETALLNAHFRIETYELPSGPTQETGENGNA